MYEVFRKFCEKILRIPSRPLPPQGQEEGALIFRAARGYLFYLWIQWGIKTLSAVFFTVLFFSFSLTGGWELRQQIQEGFFLSRDGVVFLIFGFILLSMLLRALIRLALIQLDYEKRWYIVTDRSLRIREGVTAVREMTFTFANIQNLSVSQGPIQRWLGISDLRVETAGGGGAVGKSADAGESAQLHSAFFHGIDRVEEVQKIIAERMRAYRDSGLGQEQKASYAPQSNRKIEHDFGLQQALQQMHREAHALRLSAEKYMECGAAHRFGCASPPSP